MRWLNGPRGFISCLPSHILPAGPKLPGDRHTVRRVLGPPRETRQHLVPPTPRHYPIPPSSAVVFSKRAYCAKNPLVVSILNCGAGYLLREVTDDSSPSQVRPPNEPADKVGVIVGGVLLAICFLITTAAILSWTTSLLFGAGLAFWPAIAIAFGVLAITIVTFYR